MPSEMLKPNMQVSGDVTAALNYIKPDATVTPEVVYSGGDAAQSYNEAYAFMDAPIIDGRANSENFDIHTQGFQLITSPTKFSGFDNQEAVEGAYYDEVKAIVRETTGAKEVFVFDHIVRLGEKIAGANLPIMFTMITQNALRISAQKNALALRVSPR